MAQLNHEPSMEDILASIKRIIAEDSEAAVARSPRIRRDAAPAPVATEEGTTSEAPRPIFEALRKKAEARYATAAEPETDLGPAEQPEEDRGDGSEDVLELTSPISDESRPMPVQAATTAGEPTVITAAVPATDSSQTLESEMSLDRLMSDPAALASRNAFAALAQMQVRAEAGQENTLEGLVADLLRPMLREWLDRELPALVERMVQAEIARVSGRAL